MGNIANMIYVYIYLVLAMLIVAYILHSYSDLYALENSLSANNSTRPPVCL